MTEKESLIKTKERLLLEATHYEKTDPPYQRIMQEVQEADKRIEELKDKPIVYEVSMKGGNTIQETVGEYTDLCEAVLAAERYLREEAVDYIHIKRM